MAEAPLLVFICGRPAKTLVQRSNGQVSFRCDPDYDGAPIGRPMALHLRGHRTRGGGKPRRPYSPEPGKATLKPSASALGASSTPFESFAPS